MTSRRRLIVLVALAGLLLAAAASAEVRIASSVDGVPTLVVQPMGSGIWSSRRQDRPGVLNPEGDILGDGAPSHASQADRILVAWSRPASQRLVAVHGTTRGVDWSREIAVEGSVAAPVVARVGRAHWLVGWQALGSSPVVRGAVLREDGTVACEVAPVDGQLLGSIELASTTFLVVAGVDSGLLQLVPVASFVYYPDPIPLPAQVVAVLPNIPALSPVKLNGVGPSGDLRDGAVPKTCASTTGGGRGLLAWIQGPHEVGYVVLTADGIEGTAEFLDGPAGSCQAILNAVERQLPQE